MDAYITMLTLILLSVHDTYICDILNDIDQAWLMFIDETEQRMRVQNIHDNLSEQAFDTSTNFNERIDSINKAIIDP